MLCVLFPRARRCMNPSTGSGTPPYVARSLSREAAVSPPGVGSREVARIRALPTRHDPGGLAEALRGVQAVASRGRGVRWGSLAGQCCVPRGFGKQAVRLSFWDSRSLLSSSSNPWSSCQVK